MQSFNKNCEVREVVSRVHETPPATVRQVGANTLMGSSAPLRVGIPRGPDGLPEFGWVRLSEAIRPAGPLPISRSQFWLLVKEGRLKAFKLSPRVTVFEVSSIRALLTASKAEGHADGK